MSSSDKDEEFLWTTEEEEEPKSYTKRKKRTLMSSDKKSRPRYRHKWESQFPWLRSHEQDEHTGFCILCNKKMVSKKSHLERHERSLKHRRLAGEDTESEFIAEPTETEFLECGSNIEDDEELGSEFQSNDDSSIKLDSKFPVNNNGTLKTRSKNEEFNDITVRKKMNFNRLKLLKHIERSRNELNDYYYAHCKPHETRNSLDLFFDSVCASVKLLPPKMAVEIKSRISFIISEYEVQAISEREAQETASTHEVSQEENSNIPEESNSPTMLIQYVET